MVDNVVNDSTQLSSIKAREGGRYADQGGNLGIAPIGRVPQSKVFENIEIRRADNVMGFVDKDEFVARGVKLVQAFTRDNALYRGNCDVGGTRGMVVAHLDIHMLICVGTGAVAGGLLDKLPAVGEDECLRGMADGRHSVDEVSEYDRLASACGQ